MPRFIEMTRNDRGMQVKSTYQQAENISNLIHFDLKTGTFLILRCTDGYQAYNDEAHVIDWVFKSIY